MSQNQVLQTFRDKIDEIDEDIIRLLVQRMDVILRVAEFKKNNGEKFFIKSSREADMVKNLLRKVDKKFPHLAIVNIWRKIITVANMQEQPLRIVIHNPNDISDYGYLVREYYAPEVPISHFDSANNVILELERNEAQIAIFALPKAELDEHKEDAKENWWVALANNRKGLRVFAKIPFVESADEEKNRDQIQLVAVAAKEPEKSSDDNSLLYVEVSREVSKAQILSALKEQSMIAKILKSVKINQVEGIIFYLVEIEGFYLENDVAIRSFVQNKIKPFVKILGHYATPIKI